MKTRKLLVGLTHLTLAMMAFQIGLFYSLYQRSNSDNHHSCRQHAPYRWVDSYRPAPLAPSFIPSSLTKLLVGLSTADIKSFLRLFPFGFPLFGWENPKYDRFGDKWNQVLFLYLHPSSLPSKSTSTTTATNSRRNQAVATRARKGAVGKTTPSFPQHASAGNATRHCAEVKHIVTHIGTLRNRQLHTCLAIVGASSGTESYVMNKWMRNNDDQQNGNKLPISHRRVGRYQFTNTYKTWNGYLTITPVSETRRTALKVLHDYLDGFDEALAKLKPIADEVANHPGDDDDSNSVSVRGNLIVLVCNFGHAKLFMNFVCAARAAGLNLHKILLIATDIDTYELAQSLGIAAFYDARIFASIPRNASELYGSTIYANIMMSKVYAVHLISQLGYNFLFQDVDIMIYKPNYLEWFVQKAASGEYDLYFQHDFNERAEYSPWISNSGCYYAVNNARTRYLFAEMVYQGDKIITTRSHQAVLHTVLSEHVSQFALRTKTLREHNELFPIGWHYHKNKEFMREMISHAKSKQMSLHMNWNLEKVAKRQYLEQIGDWYLQDACAGEKTLTEIKQLTAAAASEAGGVEGMTTTMPTVMASCCSDKPLIQCHWRDKPSVIPCKNSPANTKNAQSFW